MHIKINDTNWIFNKQYTTHMGVLVKVFQMSSGPIAELGGGLYSTPLLHWMCAEDKRSLTTYEDNNGFWEFIRKFKSSYHSVKMIKRWDEVPTTHWGMVFIDHDAVGETNITSQRKLDALRLANCSDYIVIHDSDSPGYTDEFWKKFKYVKHWDLARPTVSIVSNFKEL